MPNRARSDADNALDRFEQGDPNWPAQLAVAATLLLNIVLPDKVRVGPSWMVPAIGAVLLLTLIVVAPRRLTHHSPGRRRFSLVVVAVVSVANLLSLGLLIHYLTTGGIADGERLLVSGVVLWGTNVLLYSVWYWEFDQGGPVERFRGTKRLADFQFPQSENPELAPKNWRPTFGDYLYTSLTNATAFSPTDTMPLTHLAKAMMGTQSVTALLTLGLVVARAVNILG
jgi:uncharacterized membrane protein